MSWINLAVSGTATWPTEEANVEFGGHTLLLRPATDRYSQSIHIELRRISHEDAYTLANRFLSALSWCDDQPTEITFGFSGGPKPQSLETNHLDRGYSIAFPFHRKIEKDPKALLALALYREARILQIRHSIPLAVLSYFKILNIFWKDKFSGPKNARTNPMIEGIRTALPNVKDSIAKTRIKDLAATNSDVAVYLYESCRCAVAHANTNPVVDPDSIDDLMRLSQDIDIVKEIASTTLEREFAFSRSIIG